MWHLAASPCISAHFPPAVAPTCSQPAYAPATRLCLRPHLAMQLTLQELQSAAAPAVTATNWDDLTLSLDYSADGSNPQSPTLRLPLVKGSPYISAQVLWRVWAPGAGRKRQDC